MFSDNEMFASCDHYLNYFTLINATVLQLGVNNVNTVFVITEEKNDSVSI